MNYSDICKKFNIETLIGADLSGADLKSATLSGADLSRAYLRGADLSRADLRDTNLSGANLKWATLSGADLSRADLRGADLSGASLWDVDLSIANLIGANLSGATLNGANLSGAKGIGNKEDEMLFASKILVLAKNGQLEMGMWHTCATVHCIAGWAFPSIEYPAPQASLKYPTLAKYFYCFDEEVIEVLERVASGKESVFYRLSIILKYPPG